MARLRRSLLGDAPLLLQPWESTSSGPSTFPLSMRLSRSLVLLLLAAVVSSCGGSSTSPSAPPVSPPAPSSASGPNSLNMALRSQLNLAALGASAGSGNWGYTSPNGRRFALVGTSVGLSVVDVKNPGNARLPGPGRDPRARALQPRRQLDPQRLAHPRRPLHLHDRRAGGLPARGLGP